jgi:hypothetical protein
MTRGVVLEVSDLLLYQSKGTEDLVKCSSTQGSVHHVGPFCEMYCTVCCIVHRSGLFFHIL